MTRRPSSKRTMVITRLSDMPRSEPCTHHRLGANFSSGPWGRTVHAAKAFGMARTMPKNDLGCTPNGLSSGQRSAAAGTAEARRCPCLTTPLAKPRSLMLLGALIVAASSLLLLAARGPVAPPLAPPAASSPAPGTSSPRLPDPPLFPRKGPPGEDDWLARFLETEQSLAAYRA